MARRVSVVAEIERKYEAPGGVEVDPGALPGTDSPPREHDLAAVYYDTPDLRLLRAGVTLRRRTGGSDPGWHLKLPAGKDHRDEVRLPLDRARRRPPAELAALVRAHSRGADLAPVVELRTRRREWVISGSDGEPTAELVDDHVTARSMGAETSTPSWHEVEVELVGRGTVEHLDALDRDLLAAGLRRSRSASKLARALGRRTPADAVPPTAGRRSTAGDVVLHYLTEQAHTIRRHDALVRLDRPDAVHQMRVAARRMRSALQAFGGILDRRTTAGLVADLAWAAGELGPARDTEVLAERFDALFAQLPDDLVLGPVNATLTRIFARRSADDRARAIAALDSDRYLGLLDQMDGLLAGPSRTAPARRPADHEIPAGVARAHRRLVARMDVALRAGTDPERDVALHDARKAAKRLRYATEVAIPVSGKPARRLQRRLRDFQDLLGERQDTVVARAALREIAVMAHLEGQNGFTYGLMHAAESDRAAAADRALPDAWHRLARRSTITWTAPRR